MKNYRLPLCVLAAALFSNVAIGQQIKWNNEPQTGFVFQISNTEAQKLLTRSRPDTIINALLHTQVDTFNIKHGWTRRPDKGHFILAKIVGNKLHCEYTSVFPYEVLLLKEYNALSLQVLDRDGNVRHDAKVKIKRRRISFDQESKTYRFENQWFNGASKIVTVELDGFRSVFNIENHEVPTWEHSYNHDYDGPDFYSYMITDKNRYKPGEHVRFKSYALTGSRRPIRRDLEIWLSKSGRPLKLGFVSPHRPGSFASEIILHDSLNLTLDQLYTLQLRDKSGRVVSSCGFKYEDYELHGNILDLKMTSDRHFYPESNYLKITATTENGLMLKDAKATVVVSPENIREVFQPLLILRDTLMIKEIPLNGDTATVVEIPSSLFQKSNTVYNVNVSVVNSENQRMESSISSNCYFLEHELVASYSGDSIVYQLLEKGTSKDRAHAKMFRDNAITGVDVILPYREKINPATATVRMESALASRTFTMASMLPKLKFVGGIKRDSFNISVDNPQKIDVSWYVYQGSQLLDKGFGEEVLFKSKIEDRTYTYYVELLYSFGGSDHVASKPFPFSESSLDITLNLPERVYPGQKVDALIDVTDEEGNPISGVDLTAFATTAKLDYYPANLPYYGGASSPRSQQATYTKHNLNKRNAVLELDYGRWRSKAGLDTMKYYQFTYPGNRIFFHEVESYDSTQFSAFVMQRGAAREVHVIEVDGTPVYFAWTQQPKAYSFYIQPEQYKTVALRLFDRVLILDSLCVEKGKRTILSFDLDHLPKGITTHNIAPKVVNTGWRKRQLSWQLTDTERQRNLSYLAAFKETDYPSFLSNKHQFVPITYGKQGDRKLIVGPISKGTLTYTEYGSVPVTYKHVGGFAYEFDGNIVYKTDIKDLIPEQLFNNSFDPLTSINLPAINKQMLTRGTTYFPTKWLPNFIDLVDNNTHVKLLLPVELAKSGVASVLFQNSKTREILTPCKSYTTRSDYFSIPRGLHRAIVLYNNGTYLTMDDMKLQSYATTVADMRRGSLHPADPTSLQWLITYNNDCYSNRESPSTIRVLSSPRFSRGNVHGTVFDEANAPLPGANIIVKGTTNGTVTDENGNFTLNIIDDPSTLAIFFIGYKTTEIEVSSGSLINVAMEVDIQSLQEVVVIGYGVETRRELTGAVSSVLQGKTAGVQIVQQDAQADIVDESLNDREQVREAEQQLYRELLTLKNIRSQFSDVGFWEPRLYSDKHGRSKFTVTFPDDITQWNAVVYGMNHRLQTGTARKSIKSYKSLMAELSVPQFLTRGDSVDLIGKVLNYTSDKTILGKTSWSGSTSSEQAVKFDSYLVEKLSVVASSPDTVKTSFSFTRTDGYFDGEERKVQVIEQGTIRANGTLTMLKNMDEVHLQSKKETPLNVEIFDNPLDLYAGEIQYLLHYRYDCNEQLASKLIGLINHKLLMQYERKDFAYDKDVNKIIQRLLKNQNGEFLWSWWDVSSNTSYWMSSHILRALKFAKDAGYKVNLDLTNVVRKATYKYDFLKSFSTDDVSLLHALAIWNASIDYARYVNILDKEIRSEDSTARQYAKIYHRTRYSLLNERLLLLEVRQLQHLPLVRDSILGYKKQTVLDEVYFSDNLSSLNWHSGEVSSNATAYRIVSRDSTLRDLTTPMQMYFISLRRHGGWNTYQSSNILMSILPDLLTMGTTKQTPAIVSLTGKFNSRIRKFPFKTQLTDGEQLSIRKEAGVPLFCMQYYEERVTTAQSGTDAFTISTKFDQRSLKAGSPVTLTATVEVKRDAALEHVMIEIPIPASCSYADKRQPNYRIETHREYFKEKTVVFCEKMTAGTYHFQVQLLPRFTGKFHVNPAQVSLMYFPVIGVNTAMEKVVVRE